MSAGRNSGRAGQRLLRRCLLVLCLLLGVLGRALPAGAHGTPVALAIWGDFPPAVAGCQRDIGRAAAVCGLQAWRLRRDCSLAALHGTPCTATTLAARIEAARLRAADRVSSACSGTQVSILQFLDLSEAQRDAVRFCREVDDLLAALVLEPIQSGGSAVCAVAAATATTKLLGLGFRSRQRVLGRIAQHPFTPSVKRHLVGVSDGEIAAARAALAAAVGDTCPADAFGALFGRDVDALLAAVASRSDCLAGEAYAQDGVVCPPAECGNRLRERGEECDDGNQDEGDGCSADCRRT